MGNESGLVLGNISFEVLSAAFEVYNTLGPGFLEKVYENAMAVELASRGMKAEAQRDIQVYYKGSSVGSYFADLLVNNEVIVELKSVESLSKIHEAQVLNYLKATGKKLGLLINFGKSKVEHKRFVI